MTGPRRTHEGSLTVTWPAPWRLDLPGRPPPAGGFPLLVALHGHGETGAALADRLALPDDAPYARLFPTAPFPVVVGEGAARREGRSWYAYTGDQGAFRRALHFGEELLAEFIGAVATSHPVAAGTSVLMGYSQGGYLAAFAALRARDRYRGLVAVSCRVKVEALRPELETARGYPVLGIHGKRDRSVLPGRQEEAFAELRRLGLDAELHLHERGHGFPRELHGLLDAFVRRVLPGGG